jgi:filamentous hemagglutinin family protein
VTGVVQSGQATIGSSGATMTIDQTSATASINWQSFSVGQEAAVNIVQSGPNAVLLNRVVGSDPSQIMGKITANGQIILVNPNGIIVGPGGMVSASSFTATTFALDEQDFQNGHYRYYRNGSAAGVVNEGRIETVPGGGYVALIGAQVTNTGAIKAPEGTVVLAAGETVTLSATESTAAPQTNTSLVGIPLSSKVKLELTPAAINTAIRNTSGGVIETNGGQVLVETSVLASAVAQIVQSGVIDASGAQGGDVRLLAEGGNIDVRGTIKSNSADGTAGGAGPGHSIVHPDQATVGWGAHRGAGNAEGGL